jgi:hypothetical protein
MTDPAPPDLAEPDLDPELEEALASDEPITPALRTSKGESVGAAVGSFMAGIEQQVFQRRPPGVELVREHAPIRGTSSDGLEVTIDVPPLPPER